MTIRKKLQREEEGGFPQVVLNDNLNEVRALSEQILGTRQMWEDIYLRKQKVVRTGCLGKIEETRMGEANTKRDLKVSQKGTENTVLQREALRARMPKWNRIPTKGK